MSAKLFVGNLPHDTTSDDLRTLFAGAGVVESCNVITDRDSGRSKGFGFVEMDCREAADTAKEKLHGQDFHGRLLTVKEAKPQNDSRNNGGPRRY